MYVLIAPQAVEPPPLEIAHAPLVVSDYPTSSSRLLALYAYYRIWGARPFPFLDRRVLTFVPEASREAFVRYTNLYYNHAVRSIERSFASVKSYANRLDLCYDCRKLGKCRDICLLGLANIPTRNAPDTVRLHIQAEASQFKSNRRGATQYCDNRYVLFGDLLDYQQYHVKCTEVRDLPVNVNSVPLDQKEWWVE